MSKKTPIPPLNTGNSQIDRFASAVKTNLDQLTGQQASASRVDVLPTTASLSDVIAAVNVLIERQGK